MSRHHAQAKLFDASERSSTAPSQSDPGHFEPVEGEEGGCIGRAVVAQLRGEVLTPEQRASLARARASSAAAEREWDRRAPPPVIDVSETLLVFERGPRTEVRVSWRRYKGSAPFLDIRRWEKDARGMHPTRQGVTIRLRELPRLLRVLLLAARHADDDTA